MIDLTNQRFGRWTVLKEVDRADRGRRVWLCRCDCGSVVEVFQGNLRSGHSKSCGCLSRKHGGRRDRLYRVWCGMKDRCYNPKHKDYPRYGGRGIRVCPEWENNYITFRSWALAHGARKGLQLDRRNNDGHYEPDNCHFVTPAENVRNSTTTKLRPVDVINIRHLDEIKLMSQKTLAKLFGVSRAHINNIVNRKCWENV